MSQVFDLVYGTTLRGKSLGIVKLVEALYGQTGKKFRLYIGDGGVETYYNSGLVDLGILEVIEYDGLDMPFTVMDRMVNYWAPDKSGKWAPPPANFSDLYAGAIFEGAAVLGKYLLGHNKGGLAYRAGQGELIGNKNDDAVVRIKDDSFANGIGDGVLVGSNTMGHYRVMQPALLGAIKKSKRFPGSTPASPKGWVIWTSHPVETVDKSEGGKTGDFGKLVGKTIVGPDMGGKAMTDWVSREFGNTLHFDIATKVQKEADDHTSKQVSENVREYRIYTRDHYDPDAQSFTEFRAGNRCPIPEMMPDYIAAEKNEEAGSGLVKFYSLMAEAKKESIARKQKLVAAMKKPEAA